MGTILSYRPLERRKRQDKGARSGACEIVIFPGVRIERHDLDLSHRLRDSAGTDDFNGLGGKRGRPRKTS